MQGLSSHRYAKGFTYLAVLFFVAFLGIGLSSIGLIWYRVQKSENEQELLFVGHQFRNAIKDYYYSTPGISMYPASLSDLLKDPRQMTTRRYLRKIYRDPMTGGTNWGIIRTVGGGIIGVFSQSQESPQKKAAFGAKDEAFEAARTYSDWKFVFDPQRE